MATKPSDAQEEAERRAFNAMNARPPEKSDKIGAEALRDRFAIAIVQGLYANSKLAGQKLDIEALWKSADEIVRQRPE